MKNYLPLLLLLGACKASNNDGTYINHTDGQYSIVDDTLVLKNTVVINRVGFQKIREGKTLLKSFKVNQWTLHSPDAPLMQISNNQIQIGSTIYTKLP